MNLRAKLGRVERWLMGGGSAVQEAARLGGGVQQVAEDALGFRFILDPCDAAHQRILVEREYDRALFQAMKRLIRPGNVVFDVGAHVGEISVLAARLSQADGIVFAFEPVAESCARFRENVALNGCENISLHAVAVGERAGTVTMNVFPAAYSAWSSRGKPLYAGADGVPVAHSTAVDAPCVTLDEFCTAQEIPRIHFLKVDVEGYECDVFRGAARLLGERRIDLICFEISQIPLKGAGRTAREIFEILEGFNFLSYRFDERTNKFAGPVRDSAEAWTNYFAAAKAPENW